MDGSADLRRRELETLIEVRIQQAEMIKTLKEIIPDHEKRIRFLERTIACSLGALALVKFILEK